jgi:hypothetical protein
MQYMPTILDVDDIHTLEYQTYTMQVEEERNPSQEAGQPEDDTERTESDASRGKGP